jgi:hypothetical protein
MGKIAASAVLLGLFALGCDKATYEVSGEGKATIKYWDGGVKTEKDITLPWKKEVVASDKNALQATGQGQLDCSITTEAGGIKGKMGVGKCATGTITPMFD